VAVSGGVSHETRFMLRELEWMQVICLTLVVNLVVFLTCPAAGSSKADTKGPYIQSEKCVKGYSSSTISCGTGFLFTEFCCDPSSSERTSEPPSSLLSHSGWSEYSSGAGGSVAALRLFRNRNSIAARTSKVTIVGPTSIPAFAPALKPLFVVAREVSDEIGEEVAATVVGVLVREREVVGESTSTRRVGGWQILLAVLNPYWLSPHCKWACNGGNPWDGYRLLASDNISPL
jgi:hypothetical protein